jgi:RecA/RadA recombinase
MNWKELAKAVPGTKFASDRDHPGEFTGFIDTGCYALNALMSGSIFGGIPNNKITALCGESSTGKSFFALSIVRSFLDSDHEAGVIYYDTEAAITTDMIENRNIDSSRLMLVSPATLEDFRTHALSVLNVYETAKKRAPLLIVLDSLGMLSSSKEMQDTADGKETRDMTKAQLIRGIFRVLTIKLAQLQVPLIMTNHTYQVVGAYVPTKEASGGGGVKYAASQICMLSKKKDRDSDKTVTGNLIRVQLHKSRLTKENSEVTLKLSYSTGLDKYYGLVDIASKHGIIKKIANRWEFPDGSKVFEKALNKEPEKYFTEELMQEIDKAANQEFAYGMTEEEEVEVD